MKLLIAAAALVLATTQSTAALAHEGHDHSAPAPVAGAAAGVGVVKAVNAAAGTVTIAHEPIKALNWGAMVMPFKAADPAILKDVKVGQKVNFQIKAQKIVAIKAQ